MPFVVNWRQAILDGVRWTRQERWP